MDRYFITSILTIFFLAVNNTISAQNSVIYTNHNLSVYGSEIRSISEEQVCIFCHATHGSENQTALWNRYDSPVIYTLYGSPTMVSKTRQPGLNSRLCLSCHDGTVALGLVRSRENPIAFPVGLDKIPPEHPGNLSGSLADDHPITLDFNTGHFEAYSCSGCHEFSSINNHSLECSSCHDPHDNTYGKFLVADPIYGGLCLRCHSKTNWNFSLHLQSDATWNGISPDPWPKTKWETVAENSCHNCHSSHTNLSKYWLLKYPAEEDNCYVCHNGNVAQKNIEIEMLKTSSHPVRDFNNVHTPNEDPRLMERHVECSDCHEPHQVSRIDGSSFQSDGSIKGVGGIDQNGNVLNSIRFEYELCYKCHQSALPSTQYVPRVDFQSDIRLEFSETNPSYHPVVARGMNSDVPSLTAPYSVDSIIRCTDCHNNDNAGFSDSPGGPHGSIYAPILKRQLIFNDGNPESQTWYALCYQCHDRNSILNDESGFPHANHVLNVKASCTTCHDPHGSFNNSHLINFNNKYVLPGLITGRIEFIDNGTFSGECYLKCHNENHEPGSY